MSDEVSQFLEQVERLRGQQIEDDEARAREREEFLAAKRERQARRQERARSISPQKSSPANTPSPRSNRQSVQVSDATRLDSPVRLFQDREPSPSPSIEPEDSMPTQSLPDRKTSIHTGAEGNQPENSTSTSPTRTPTLSWQRRPTSRGGGRPLSMVAAQNATQRSLAGSQEPVSATEESVSKDQIAKALGAKDPAWFRQTSDRGQGSAAYRRNQVEDDDRLDMSSVRAQLPGMSVARDISNDSSSGQQSSDVSSRSRLASPVALDPSGLNDATDETKSQARETADSTGRTSPLRSTSPTKGLGGFVQSAMMKRSDSVKRWSVTSPPGLTRADSVAATRGAYDRSSVHMGSRSQGVARDVSTTPTSSRPTSQQGERQSELAGLPKLSSQQSMNSAHRDGEDTEESNIPTSPSKTMDSRRWSPTKPTWLDSALNRPESPKSPLKPSQSTWRVNAAAESTRSPPASHKHQVSIGGLMRQSALGSVAKSNPTGLGGIYSPPPNANRPAFGHGSKPSMSQMPSDIDLTHPKVDAPVEDKEDDVVDASAAAEKPLATKSQVPILSPPQVKPKPQISPASDLRSNLKQRSEGKNTTKAEELEFKNVFGNLRRAKTQNYVAPDELKDNILRGKAALNVTDGPQKSERRDEFKDAILKKKADFKSAQAEGRGVTKRSNTSSDQLVPEGLARRAELGKSAASKAMRDRPTEMSAAKPSTKVDSPKPTPGPKRVSSGSSFSAKSPNATQTPSRAPGAEQLRRVATEPETPKVKAEPPAPPSLRKQTSEPSKALNQNRLGGGGGGKLADRFNPALAGILARGPPSSTVGGRSEENTDENDKPGSSGPAETTGPGPQLTHMTKNRARGPRRKAPRNSATASAAGSGRPGMSQEPKEPKELQQKLSVKTTPIKKAKRELPTQKEQSPSVPLSRQADVSSTQRDQPPFKAVPETKFSEPVKSTKQAPVSVIPGEHPALLKSKAAPPVSSTKAMPQAEGEPSPASSPKKLDMKRVSCRMDRGQSNIEVHSFDEPEIFDYQRSGSRSPTKSVEPPSPTKSDRDSLPSMMNASPRLSAVFRSPPPLIKHALDEPATPGGQGRRSARPLSALSGDGWKSPGAASPVRSPSKLAGEVSIILTDFFGPSQTRKPLQIDPAQILLDRPETGDKVTSLGVQMFQISGDGKKTPVSPQNERVLFDQEMYVCAHNFMSSSGKKEFEVYFWVGDEVPESAAEDAQLFVQREARSLGGKVIKLRQAKETAEFVQALGGVIIVRRGSSHKYDSLAPNMLCGRRYLGQVAFDEVDFTPASLCAGFTYLVTKAGNCYMWNGKGSDITEMSCARLVGMDLTLTGELVEYSDGTEPSSFWDLFEEKTSKPHSADHWRLKPNYDKYCSRLFCSDADSRQQILEISPFSQVDLSPANIYVLDAFFEIYVIVGSRANSQYASFCNALDFAQEYAILASSMEDRPFVPVSSVVLEGIPRDLKRVFRKWDEAKSPTVTNVATGGLRRGKSLRVVPLTQALQAMRE